MDKHILICPHCGSEIEVVDKQTIGHCTCCDTLLPLPSFIINQDKFNSTTFNNMLNRVNKATEFSLSYQFHRAYNLFDKLIKNNYNLNIRDAFPFIGKFLNQYGVAYIMNDNLETELVCLNILKESIYENEYYQKALIYSDSNVQSIIKKRASEIDKFQKEVRKELIKSEPVDICIMIDDTIDDGVNLEYAKTLQTKFTNLKHKVVITEGCFNQISKENIIKLNQCLSMAKYLIILSKNSEHLNDTLFRNSWMSYFNDSEIAQNPINHISVITDDKTIKDSLPIKDLNFYSTNELDQCVMATLKCFENYQVVEEKDLYPELTALLNQDEYDLVRDELNKKLKKQNLDYQGWLLMFLSKHRIKSLDDMEKLVINPIDSYYYQRIYMYASRDQKVVLYEYYLKCLKNLSELDNINEEYETLLKEEQEKLYKNDIIGLSLRLIPILFTTILSIITLSICSVVEIIIMLIINIAAYAFFASKLIKILLTGKIPAIIRQNNGEKAYIQQLKKVVEPDVAAKYVPGEGTRKHHKMGLIILGIALLMTFTYLTKEIVVKAQNSSINYYYVFNKAYVIGGTKSKVLVPEKISGKKVVGISKNAFYRNGVIEELYVEEGLTTIASGAFKECPNLKTVTLPSTVTSVYGAPFEGCSNMHEFTYYGRKIKPSDFFGNNYQAVMKDLVYINK